MRQLVAHVDSSLGTHVSLGAMADTVGLSPSRFARKFRLSTGLSVNRFMNTRRICMSFAMLSDPDQPLAAVSLALGFSSQSHVTRRLSGKELAELALNMQADRTGHTPKAVTVDASG